MSESETTPPAEEPQQPSMPTSNEDVALTAKVDQLEKQVNDYKLLIADMQNSARRLREDAERQRKYFGEGIVRDLLQVFDNLERAIAEAAKNPEPNPLTEGVSATLTQFLETLKRHHATKIDVQPGSEFDPNLHMAVMQQPTNDFAVGQVVQVLQQGFLLHDRVIRPSTVIVASEPPAGSEME